jgi:protein-L-isoaspartate O-methyltransferase
MAGATVCPAGSGKGEDAASAVADFCRVLPRPPFPAMPRHLCTAVRPGGYLVFPEGEISAFSRSGGARRGVADGNRSCSTAYRPNSSRCDRMRSNLATLSQDRAGCRRQVAVALRMRDS